MKMRKEWGKKEEENFTIILWRASKQASEGISWAERSVQ